MPYSKIRTRSTWLLITYGDKSRSFIFLPRNKHQRQYCNFQYRHQYNKLCTLSYQNLLTVIIQTWPKMSMTTMTWLVNVTVVFMSICTCHCVRFDVKWPPYKFLILKALFINFNCVIWHKSIQSLDTCCMTSLFYFYIYECLSVPLQDTSVYMSLNLVSYDSQRHY